MGENLLFIRFYLLKNQFVRNLLDSTVCFFFLNNQNFIEPPIRLQSNWLYPKGHLHQKVRTEKFEEWTNFANP